MLQTAKLMPKPIIPTRPIEMRRPAKRLACLSIAWVIFDLHVPAVGGPFLTSENRKKFYSVQNPEQLKSVSRISRIGKYFVFYYAFITLASYGHSSSLV